jgi:hypothetical protein
LRICFTWNTADIYRANKLWILKSSLTCFARRGGLEVWTLLPDAVSPATPTVTDNDAGAPVTILAAAISVPVSAGPGILAGLLPNAFGTAIYTGKSDSKLVFILYAALYTSVQI